MSRTTHNSRNALRLLACGLAAAAIVVPATPAYAVSGGPAPYQHDAGTAPVSAGPGTAPFQHDAGTAASSPVSEIATYRHDFEPSADPGAPAPTGYVHDLEPSADPGTPTGEVVSVSDESGGFDWTMAGILLAALLGVITLAAAGGTALRQSRGRVARH